MKRGRSGVKLFDPTAGRGRGVRRVPAGAGHDLPEPGRRSPHRHHDRRGRRAAALRVVAFVLQQHAASDQPDHRRRADRRHHRGHAGHPIALRGRRIAVSQRHSGYEDAGIAVARRNRGAGRSSDRIHRRSGACRVDLFRNRRTSVPDAVPDAPPLRASSAATWQSAPRRHYNEIVERYFDERTDFENWVMEFTDAEKQAYHLIAAKAGRREPRRAGPGDRRSEAGQPRDPDARPYRRRARGASEQQPVPGWRRHVPPMVLRHLRRGDDRPIAERARGRSSHARRRCGRRAARACG